MKKFGLFIGLISIVITAQAGKLLTEDEIYELKNPYQADLEFIRFEYCKNGLIPFRSIASTPKKELKESLGFYEFEKEDLKYAQTRVIQFAVKMGKKYNGKKIDDVVGKYWNQCLEMPLKHFENDQIDADHLEDEDVESYL